MFWIYWDPFWSLFFSAVWFMTIVSYPDASRSPAGSPDAIDLSPTEAKKPDRTPPRSWELPVVMRRACDTQSNGRGADKIKAYPIIRP
jgi:hypothetical protein